MEAQSELVERDLKHIWHPFTQMQTADDPIPITRGKGAVLYAEDGAAYLDATSSWCANLHGHSHPYIAEKIYSQALLMEHVLFAGFTHKPAVDLAERLLAILPGEMSRIFYSDNGSTSVEVSLKMALQYWYNQNPNTLRKKILCFENGYHGDTFGAMSASGKTSFNKPFWDHLFQVEAIPLPVKGKEELARKKLLRALLKKDLAAFIYEPLLLGTGGMQIYSEKDLEPLLNLCKEHGVLLIADEVMTGFGRTGTLFASEKMHVQPDIICLSKGLTGGFLPLGVCATREKIYEGFLSNEKTKALLHGHTFTANPLSCTAALASLDLLLTDECSFQRKQIEEAHRSFTAQISSHPKIFRSEYLGTILVVEYKTVENSYFSSLKDHLVRLFLKRGIIVRPLGNVLYVMPPYCITRDELARVYETIMESLENL